MSNPIGTTTCTLVLKPGKETFRAKGLEFRADAEVRVPADLAGRLLQGHPDELALRVGEPIEPPGNASKAAALRLLVGPDRSAWLGEFTTIPEAVRKALVKKDASDEDVIAAAKAGGPVATALFCQLSGFSGRAERCLSVLG